MVQAHAEHSAPPPGPIRTGGRGLSTSRRWYKRGPACGKPAARKLRGDRFAADVRSLRIAPGRTAVPACAQARGAARCGRPLRLAPDRTSSARIGRMDRQPIACGEVAFAVRDQLVVRRSSHQLDELRLVGDVSASRATCASVLPEQYQSRSWPPGPQPRRSYSPIVTSVYDVSSCRLMVRKVRRIGSCQQTSGFVSSGLRPCCSARECSAQPAPVGKSWRLWKMQADWPSCSTTFVLRSPSSSFSIQSDFLTFPPCACGWNCHRSGPSWSTYDETRFSSALSAKCAPSVQHPTSGDVGVDAVAALAEDARVARGQPGQVALEHLVSVARVDELDEGAREDQIDLRHRTSLGRGARGNRFGPCASASWTSAPTRGTSLSSTRIVVRRRCRRTPTRSRCGWPSTSRTARSRRAGSRR